MAARAVDAARVVGLDIAGVDVVCCDVAVPLDDQAGVIVEVNAAPGLRMHLEPSAGKPRAVGRHEHLKGAGGAHMMRGQWIDHASRHGR